MNPFDFEDFDWDNEQIEHDPYNLEYDWDIINWECTPWRSRKRSVLRAVLLNWLIDHPDKTIKEEFDIDLYEVFELKLKLRSELDYFGPDTSLVKIWMERNNATQRDFEIRALTFFTKERWNDFMTPGPIDELYKKLLEITVQPNTILEDYESTIWYFIDKFYMTEKLPEEIFEFFPNIPPEEIENLFHLIIKPEQLDININDLYECANQRNARQSELKQDIQNLTDKYQVDYNTPGINKIDFTKRYDLKQEYKDIIQNLREQEPINEPNTLTWREYALIAKYMDNGNDLIKLTKTHKKCKGLIEHFKYNPIPLITTRDFNLFEPRSTFIRPKPERAQRRTVRTVVERPFCRYVHYDEQEDFMLYHYSPLNNAKRFRIFERLCALWQIYEPKPKED